ncbi:protein tyrosine phosphatase domain-containing protein 1-like [Centruroides vittatus]|uniref:protein tyrosine phosphatase domain-containing protein 1-like n=1 Tax=Centruroides vittatus TaxID=120091 RepID=UPI00350F340D
MSSELETALPPVTTVGRHSVTYGQSPPARYSKLSEKFRQNAPSEFQCSVFCGGKKCKYESPKNWSHEDMTINGIYSHWVTDDILAMARPSTEVIEKYNVIQQFQEQNIKSIINLQMPGEHSTCGNNLESSGFSYDPQLFMDNDIFFYNFRWKDYGTVSEETLLDMVKVMAFALSEGKVAVHCHAGLGRTGVLIACYLVYSLRCKPNDAIRYVRVKRPQAIQTRNQIQSVQRFAQCVIPLFVVFSNVIPKAFGFNLNQYLNRQRHLIHGLEARHLKFIPKLVYIICERLLVLANCQPSPNGENLNYDIENANSFCNFFLSASSPEDSNWRPPSQLTLQLDADTPEKKKEEENGRQGNCGHCRGDMSKITGKGALYQLRRCETRCDQEETFFNYEEFVPGDGRGSSSLSGSSSNPEDVGHFTQSSSINSEDFDTEASDDGIDSMLMEEPTTEDLSQNPCYQELELRSLAAAGEENKNSNLDSTDIVKALIASHCLLGPEFQSHLKQYQKDLNNRGSAWERLAKESDPILLTGILWSWLDHLKTPILNKQDLTYIVLKSEKPVDALARLDKDTRFTIEYLIRFVARLLPNSLEPCDDLLRRLVASLTHQCLAIHGVLHPVGAKWSKMREGTTTLVMHFVRGIYKLSCGLPLEEEEYGGRSRRRKSYMGINLMAQAIGKSNVSKPEVQELKSFFNFGFKKKCS